MDSAERILVRNMRTSKYNFFCKVAGRQFVYQLLSGSLLQIDEELYAALQTENLSTIPDSVQATLKSSNILIDDDLNEVDVVIAANLRARYRSSVLRVTVMPTLACNFNCWYCYERHTPSRMADEAAEATVRFVKRQLEQNAKKGLVLDWFGGEPLLCFDGVILPMQQQLLAWCKVRGIAVQSMMTTNGSLITPTMADQMEEIGLRQFQITLDGGRLHHNRTRFSTSIANSYDTIIQNVKTLCERIDSPTIELRINYTAKNVESLAEILDDLDDSLRPYVSLSPHIVWQEADNVPSMRAALERFEEAAHARGFTVMQSIPTVRSTTCYTENADQFMVNYNLDVYKCTARDFDGRFSIGKINLDGQFKPNGLFYRYLASPSPFTQQSDCLDCSYLPCCLCGLSCPQKQLEGTAPQCDREAIKTTIERHIKHKLNA